MQTNNLEKAICQLCKQNDATVTGSHFVSSCIVEGVFGKRGEEEAHEIDLQNLTIKSYFGPANLNNTDIEIKENFIVKDNIFCKECEDLFSILENECCYPTKQILYDLKKSNHKILKTKKQNKYFIAKALNVNVFQFFIYSLIWRQILEHNLKGEIIDIENKIVDFIAKELLKLKGLNHKQIRKVEEGFSGLDFILLTTYNKEDTTENPIMINPARINPLHIFLGTILILLFKSREISQNFEEKTFLPLSILDKELCFSNFQNKARFGIINEKQWKKAVLNFYIK